MQASLLAIVVGVLGFNSLAFGHDTIVPTTVRCYLTVYEIQGTLRLPYYVFEGEWDKRSNLRAVGEHAGVKYFADINVSGPTRETTVSMSGENIDHSLSAAVPYDTKFAFFLKDAAGKTEMDFQCRF